MRICLGLRSSMEGSRRGFTEDAVRLQFLTAKKLHVYTPRIFGDVCGQRVWASAGRGR